MADVLAECIAVYRDSDQLHSAQDVARACDRLAAALKARFADSNPLALCILKGGMIPAGLLLPRLDFPLQVDYLHATRYRDQTTGSALDWKVRPSMSLQGRIVLLIDDIHDEGVTLEAIRKDCLAMGAAEVYSVVLVNKVHNRKNNTAADFVGLDVEDRYVFGCGMDYKSYWRNAPGIYAVKEHG
ncbi:MAG: hypoxanthine-guanine phosphoribosyltransferase [Gammaproteobacteria bacterium]|nr:hypoxanthine-guanine phosphoribosyltransferase [Gammaproteobacteria bacterium]